MLHIISGDLWGGAEAVCSNLLTELSKKKGLDLHAVLLNDGRLAGEIRKAGLKVRVVDEKTHSFRGLVSGIKRITDETRPAIIHSHRYKENMLAALAVLPGKRARLIATQHGMPELYGGKDLRRAAVARLNLMLLARRFDAVVAVSEEMGRFFSARGLPPSRLKVIHNGIKIPGLPERRTGGKTAVIGSSGRLVKVKDFALLVDIAREVCDNTDLARFEIAGEGPERDDIEKRISERSLNGRFVLKGHIDDISGFYQGVDIYINTSVHEGIPISVLEAMSMGIPAIAPLTGGLGEIIEDGVSGHLARTRSPGEFAGKCLEMAGDETMRRSMGLNARKRVVERFSVERMAEKYMGLYETYG